MSDQETRDRRNRKRSLTNKKHRRRTRRAGPPPAKRRRDPWCDDYQGSDSPDPEYQELDFND